MKEVDSHLEGGGCGRGLNKIVKGRLTGRISWTKYSMRINK
jgi:hypothetical protein